MVQFLIFLNSFEVKARCVAIKEEQGSNTVVKQEET